MYQALTSTQPWTLGSRPDLELSRDPAVAAVGRSLPPNRYEQEELITALSQVWQDDPRKTKRIERLHRAVKVQGRNLALPSEKYLSLDGFGDANDVFIEVGTQIAGEAVLDALRKVDLTPADVDAIFFTTVTGLATPTIDARLVNRIGLRRDVKRVPLFGLGCVGGAAGLARMSDYLRAYPDHVAVLLSVELCSLTLQIKDLSVPNLISSGLFGDGSAAVVGLGSRRARQSAEPGPRVVATQSVFYPETEGVMGWDIGEDGFKVILSAGVPEIAKKHIGPDVDRFLALNDLDRKDITAWVCHPGGPKVLEAFESSLGLTRDDLSITWDSLEQVGNLSSASVLFVLGDSLETRPREGYWVMLAMGPGFCAELVLLEW